MAGSLPMRSLASAALARSVLLAMVCLCPASASGQAEPSPDRTNVTVDALVREAKLHHEAGETVQAEDLLHKALETDPHSVAANNALGNLYLERRRWPEAMERFESVLRFDVHNDESRRGEAKAAVAMALHYRAAGDADDSLKTLQHASSQVSGDAVLLTDLGVQAQSMGRLKIAKDALNAALAASPDNLTAHYALARVELDQQDFPLAEKEFQAYLRQRPDDATAHYGLGRTYQMQQRVEAATQEFRRSIVLQPDQAESHFQLGQMALEANRDDEARREFDETLRRMPAHGGALTGVGMLAYRAKNYADAEQALTRAVAASPDYQPAHYYLGLALRRLGRQEDSERELQIATRLLAKQQDRSAPIAAPSSE